MKNLKTFSLTVGLSMLILTSCNNSDNNKTAEKELELQKKELELKQKELDLKEKEIAQKEKNSKTVTSKPTSPNTSTPKKGKEIAERDKISKLEKGKASTSFDVKKFIGNWETRSGDKELYFTLIGFVQMFETVV